MHTKQNPKFLGEKGAGTNIVGEDGRPLSDRVLQTLAPEKSS